MDQVKRTGVIGLGDMGLPMAKHMASKGFEVAGYDLDHAAIRRAESHGVVARASSAEVGCHAQVVIVMVQNAKQVEDVIIASGLLASLTPGSVICIASSISPIICRDLAKLADEKGVGVLDTPVVLGQEAADNGTLTIYVGGEERWFARAQPALAAFGKEVLYVGSIGSGQVAKTINNMLLWACMAANMEALTLAKTLGTDMSRLIDALMKGSGANWSLSRWGKGTGKWAEKDMDVALDMAQEAKTPMPLAGLVDQVMKTINQEKMQSLLS